MSYNYQEQRAWVFTEDGQRQFLAVRDATKQLLKQAGAARMGKIMDAAIISKGGGDTWNIMACVDRLVELGEIREIAQPGRVAGQHQIYVSALDT